MKRLPLYVFFDRNANGSPYVALHMQRGDEPSAGDHRVAEAYPRDGATEEEMVRLVLRAALLKDELL